MWYLCYFRKCCHVALIITLELCLKMYKNITLNDVAMNEKHVVILKLYDFFYKCQSLISLTFQKNKLRLKLNFTIPVIIKI
jgi:hypothetical protein